jgi:hypothetical protein
VGSPIGPVRLLSGITVGAFSSLPRLGAACFAFRDVLQVIQCEGDPVAVAVERHLPPVGPGAQRAFGHARQSKAAKDFGCPACSQHASRQPDHRSFRLNSYRTSAEIALCLLEGLHGQYSPMGMVELD